MRCSLSLVFVPCSVGFSARLSIFFLPQFKQFNLHTNQRTPTQPKIKLGFCGMKQLKALLLRPGWDTCPSVGYPHQYVVGTHFIHLGGERQCGEVSCLRNTMPGTSSSTTDFQIVSPVHYPVNHRTTYRKDLLHF